MKNIAKIIETEEGDVLVRKVYNPDCPENPAIVGVPGTPGFRLEEYPFYIFTSAIVNGYTVETERGFIEEGDMEIEFDMISDLEGKNFFKESTAAVNEHLERLKLMREEQEDCGCEDCTCKD